MQNILLTGSSGFIGFHTARALCEQGYNVYGVDNENDYYDTRLKEARRNILKQYSTFTFYHKDICDENAIKRVFDQVHPDIVIHLAAQAGVRYSLQNPHAYIKTNINGFFHVIQQAHLHQVSNFIYASSSSVYGANEKIPFEETDMVDHPSSLYAGTKKSNELIAHTYSHLYDMNTTGLRFFTVYGPRGRPDMAYFSFTQKISTDQVIDVYNYGKMKRDITYIDDIVRGIIACVDRPFGYEIFNLGNDTPIPLEEMISGIEDALGKQATKNYLDMQAGDVPATWADITHAKKLLDRSPRTSYQEGIQRFVQWYQEWRQKI